jgi:ABC-2 type transport system permease protein
MRPFAGERWWVIALALGFTTLLFGVAYALLTHRDLGAGLLADRLVSSRAPSWLRGGISFGWRLQRGSVAAWTVGVTLLGLVFGALAEGVADLIRGDPQLEDFMRRFGGGPRDVVDAYLATSLGIISLLAAAFLVAAVLRLRTEETTERAEVTLSTALSRWRWAGGHCAVAALGATGMLVAAGLGAGLADGLRAHDVTGRIPPLLGGALSQVPAALVIGAIAVAIYGFVPRWSAVAWGVFAAFVLMGQLGPTLRLPQAMLDLSPFTHAPKIPGQPFELAPVLWMSAAAGLIGVLGLYGLRRRDLG